MKPIKNVLFDLDGTLTDSVRGITNCFRYTLDRLSLPVLTEAELFLFIGPPLHQTFAELLGTSDRAAVEKAVAIYRQKFDETGWLENDLYPDVPKMLAALRLCDYRLFVATSKDENAARKILRHFGLNSYFTEISGSDPAGRLADKRLLIGELLERHALNAAETIMVGDRKHDILAAIANHVLPVGVSYGYGSIIELREAGANYICQKPLDVVEAIKSINANVTAAI